MKAKQLIKLLEQYKDYEVNIPIFIDGPMCIETYEIKGILDVCYSDKVLNLNIEQGQ